MLAGGHDRIVEAGSASFATDLQATVTALRSTPPPGTPRIVVHVSSPAQMSAVTAAIAGLSVNPSGPAANQSRRPGRSPPTRRSLPR